MKRVFSRLFLSGCIVTGFLGLAACGGESASDYYKEGIRHLEQQEYEQAQASLVESIKKNPDKAEYYMDYAFALLMDGKAEDALIQFDKGYSTKDNQIVRQNNKKILRGKGIAYLSQNEYEQAKECLEQALEINEIEDLNRDIRQYLGVVYKRLGEYENALKIYTALIEEKKSDAVSYAQRAEIYALLGKVEESEADYDKAISMDGTNFSFYFGKYNLYTTGEGKKEPDAAEKAKVVLSAAYALKTTTAEDYYNLAIIHYLSGDYDLAAVELTDALSDGFAEANFYLANIYRQKGDLDNAFYYYEQYAESVDSILIASYYDGIAECYLARGEYDKALLMVEEGLKLRDRDWTPSLLYKEVYLYEQKADYGQAKAKVEAYLELYPGDSKMKEELIFLRSR